MYCEKCGRQLSDGEMFCAGCGTPVPQKVTSGANPDAGSQYAENNSGAEFQNVNQSGAAQQYYDYNAQPTVQQAPAKKSKAPFVITACSVAVALVIAIAAFFIYNSINKKTPEGQIQGTWVAEESGMSLQVEFKPDGTIGIPNATELGELISSYAGGYDYSGIIDYDQIFNMINLKYSVDEEKTLTLDMEISILSSNGNKSSQSFSWSENDTSSSTSWCIKGSKLYIGGVEFTRVQN